MVQDLHQKREAFQNQIRTVNYFAVVENRFR